MNNQPTTTNFEAAQSAALQAVGAAADAEKLLSEAEAAVADARLAGYKATSSKDLAEIVQQRQRMLDQTKVANIAALNAQAEANKAAIAVDAVSAARANADAEKGIADSRSKQADAAYQDKNNEVKSLSDACSAAQAALDGFTTAATTAGQDLAAKENDFVAAQAAGGVADVAVSNATPDTLEQARSAATIAQQQLNAATAAREQARQTEARANQDVEGQKTSLEDAQSNLRQAQRDLESLSSIKANSAQDLQRKSSDADAIAALATFAQSASDRAKKAADAAVAAAVGISSIVSLSVSEAQMAADIAAEAVETTIVRIANKAQDEAVSAARSQRVNSITSIWTAYQNRVTKNRAAVAAQRAADAATDAASVKAQSIAARRANQKLIDDALNPPAPTNSATPAPGASSSTPPCKPDANWTFLFTLLVGIIILLISMNQLVPNFGIPGFTSLYAWGLTAVLMGVFVVIVGYGTTGLWRGLFVDSRNQISLSRVQMAMWTVLILSAWLTAVASNRNTVNLKLSPTHGRPGTRIAVKRKTYPFTTENYVALNGNEVKDLHVGDLGDNNFTGYFILPLKDPSGAVGGTDWKPGQQVAIGVSRPDGSIPQKLHGEDNQPLFTVMTDAASDTEKEQIPADVAIPSQLWLAMGISIVSLVGSPLILTNKKNTDPDVTLTSDSLNKARNSGVKNPDSQGILLTKKCPADAQFVDVFRGEELGNGSHLDLAKVQMFFFTVALLITYAISLHDMFVASATRFITHLPILQESLVVLLGISHAGYLTSKAVTVTPTDGGKTNTSGGTAGLGSTAPPKSKPDKPKIKSGDQKDGKVTLGWEKGDGLTYNVYRADKAGDAGVKLTPAPIGQDNFLDDKVNKGTTYYYTITANNSIGESDRSDVMQVAVP